MSDKKYVVPIDMLRAVRAECYRNSPLPKQLTDEQILLAALRWLSENPIVPTDEQAEAIYLKHHDSTEDLTNLIKINAMVEWQRRMFLAPEPEIPEEIFIKRLPQENFHPEQAQYNLAYVNQRIAYAYRCGQNNPA